MQSLDPAAQGTLAATGRALKARLSAYFPAPKFTLELMPAAMTAEVWTLLSNRTPFVGIAFQDVVVPEMAGANPVVTQHWQLQLVVTAPTAETRLLGDSRSPGLINMTGVALLAMHGWAIEDIGTVFCGTATSLGGRFLRNDQAVMGIPLSVATMLMADEDAAALDDLEAVDITWDFTPADPTPDPAPEIGGTDTIELSLGA